MGRPRGSNRSWIFQTSFRRVAALLDIPSLAPLKNWRIGGRRGRLKEDQSEGDMQEGGGWEIAGRR